MKQAPAATTHSHGLDSPRPPFDPSLPWSAYAAMMAEIFDKPVVEPEHPKIKLTLHPYPEKPLFASLFADRNMFRAYEEYAHAFSKADAIDRADSVHAGKTEAEKSELRKERYPHLFELEKAYLHQAALTANRQKTAQKRIESSVPRPAEKRPHRELISVTDKLDMCDLEQARFGFEPHFLYQPEKLTVPGRFALCSQIHGGKFKQELFDVSQLDWVLKQVMKLPDRHQKHFWISQSTLAPWAWNREIGSVMLLNAIWADIDLQHPPESFKGKIPAGDDPEVLAALLADQMKAAGLPDPSVIIATGGGLCVKVMFENGLPSVARPRWQSLEKEFCRRISELRGEDGSSWPVDFKVCDASRILRLVGSHNPRWNVGCRIVYQQDVRYEFDSLADRVLPYTRAQVRDFRAGKLEWQTWDKNRFTAAAAGVRQSRPVAGPVEIDVGALISDEAARSLWAGRFEFAQQLFLLRGGVKETSRNNHFWPAANALAYSCSDEDNLEKALAGLHQSHFASDGWTRSEAVQSARQVIKRLKEGPSRTKEDGVGLYKMKRGTFFEKLDVEPHEKAALSHLLSDAGGKGSSHNKNREEWNVGVMGLEPIRGLNGEEFIPEVRRRQGLAGVRSAKERKTTRSIDLHEKAVLMRNSGSTQQEIAKEIGVSQRTVSTWLK